jgi:hypothetical protein
MLLLKRDPNIRSPQDFINFVNTNEGRSLLEIEFYKQKKEIIGSNEFTLCQTVFGWFWHHNTLYVCSDEFYET